MLLLFFFGGGKGPGSSVRLKANQASVTSRGNPGAFGSGTAESHRKRRPGVQKTDGVPWYMGHKTHLNRLKCTIGSLETLQGLRTLPPPSLLCARVLVSHRNNLMEHPKAPRGSPSPTGFQSSAQKELALKMRFVICSIRFFGGGVQVNLYVLLDFKVFVDAQNWPRGLFATRGCHATNRLLKQELFSQPCPALVDVHRFRDFCCTPRSHEYPSFAFKPPHKGQRASNERHTRNSSVTLS